VQWKDKIFATKLDSLCKHVGWTKTKRNIGTNVKKGDWYHFKDSRHAKNYKLLVFVAMEMLLPNLQMEWQDKIEERSNLPLSYICYNKAIPCKNTKQSSHYMNS